MPGEFSRTQNWIGGIRPGHAAFVPPVPDHVMDCLGAFDFPRLQRPARTAVDHAAFCAAGVLSEPILYLSLYFKQHRSTSNELLDRVSAKGDWESWLEFSLTGIRDTAKQAVAKSLEHLQALQHLGIAREITGKRRRRHFVYDAYLSILNEGTEPIR
jgi:hypothetical protein